MGLTSKTGEKTGNKTRISCKESYLVQSGQVDPGVETDEEDQLDQQAGEYQHVAEPSPKSNIHTKIQDFLMQEIYVVLAY